MVAVRRFVLLVLLFLASEVARGVIRSWVPIGPPGNPNVTALAVLPFGSSLFAATDGGGVLKTDDGGKTWTAINAGLSSLSVRALSLFAIGCPLPCAAPSITVFFAGTGSGVFRWDGTSWAPMNNGLSNLSVTSLVLSRTVGFFQFTLYAATEGSGIFRSDDGGGHWVSASQSQPELARSGSIAADPGSPLTAYASSFFGFFKTADGGATWSRVFQNFNVNVGAVAIDPLQGSTLYIAATVQCPSPCAIPPAPPAVMKSSDAGATWQTLAAPVMPSAFAFQVASGSSVLYVGGLGRVVSTSDGGVTWAGDQTGLSPLLAVESLAVTLSGNVFAAAPGSGVFASGCLSGSGALCLNQARFQVSVTWKSTSSTEQPGTAAPLTSNTGAFWFFDPTNLELVVKVLDGRTVNGKFWVFYGALTNVEYTITVTDMLTGAVRTYFNPQGRLASGADTSAF